MLEQVDGFEPIDESNILLIGGRDIDKDEQKLLSRSNIKMATSERIKKVGVKEAVLPLISTMRDRVDRLYIHIDLDILDPAIAPANHFIVPGGLVPDDVLSVIRAAKERFQICAAAITAYEPTVDEKGTTLQAGFSFVKEIVA